MFSCFKSSPCNDAEYFRTRKSVPSLYINHPKLNRLWRYYVPANTYYFCLSSCQSNNYSKVLFSSFYEHNPSPLVNWSTLMWHQRSHIFFLLNQNWDYTRTQINSMHPPKFQSFSCSNHMIGVGVMVGELEKIEHERVSKSFKPIVKCLYRILVSISQVERVL